jgi:hypothetical protein
MIRKFRINYSEIFRVVLQKNVNIKKLVKKHINSE